ncbi:MAG: hypothetical protein WD060_08055 [Pirellulales bacterium]
MNNNSAELAVIPLDALQQATPSPRSTSGDLTPTGRTPDDFLHAGIFQISGTMRHRLIWPDLIGIAKGAHRKRT